MRDAHPILKSQLSERGYFVKVRFVFADKRVMKNPFNGDYIEWDGRIPSINEHVCFDKCNLKYEVADVIHELVGWNLKYTVILR